MKVLLCLLSDQHVPNLLSVHRFQPDRLVLIETAQMRKREAARNFLEALRLGGLEYGERCVIEPLDAAHDLEAVRVVLRRTFGKNPSAQWIANISGGTKPMSIAAFEFFKATAGQIVYTDVARPNVLVTLESGAEETCTHKISIQEFLAGYGFGCNQGRAPQWAECAAEIAKCAPARDILALSDKDRDTAREKGWEIQPGQLQCASDEMAAAIRKAFRLSADTDGKSLCGRINKYQAEFLTGGWLEVFFCDLFQRHADGLGLWDVRLGLTVRRRDDNAPLNEFDVAFMCNYGLAIVECKSGTQSHDPASNVLYKIEAVIRQFRALRVRSYLATTGSNIFDQNGEIKTTVRERARLYDCTIITRSMIQRLAENADSLEAVRVILSELESYR
ncbi:MAG: Card1-like endonuclease domain-containing protein [Thermogutta sp.]